MMDGDTQQVESPKETDAGLKASSGVGVEESDARKEVRRTRWEGALLQAGLACPICMEFLCEPLRLDCGHSFCRLCLLQSTRLAPDGRHCPICRGQIALKDPSAHPADAALTAEILKIVPPEEIAARSNADKEKLAALLERAEKSLPIFYMQGVASRVGQLVRLHFFEPRYKILIRRAWEGNRRFICAQRAPSDGQRGLVVEVDSAVFRPDGKADIEGRGVEVVTLRHVRVEDGTAGLYYADMDAAGTNAASGIAAAPFSSQPSAGHGARRVSVEEHVLRAHAVLEAAIQEGAPRYNRGDHIGCAEIYRQAAQRCLEGFQEDDFSDCRMATLLRGGLRNARDAGGNSDAAAWALRHAFDEALALDRATASATAVVQAASTASRRNSAAVTDFGDGVEERELPVFYMFPGTSPGSEVRLRLFEPIYRELARRVWAAPERLFIYASSRPTVGATATIVLMHQCQWDLQDNALIRGLAVDRIRLGVVWQEEGLYFAQSPVRLDMVRAQENRRENERVVKCTCSLQ
eukprot:CAMPEP_0117467968 /NCGR_PEP_ID=MMETSP0784-20121206/5933_1 /TAXON_ID=39447 /ORGANISM="" /LENGTH=521 /DNA_ID=CAMNT_0005261961 /DNA_START=1 /DNA_END=1566 /DNA_ORIENTATION=+